MSTPSANANVRLSMIGTSVRLHDITDAEGFVARTILKSGLRASPQDFDELKAEGLVILCAYAQRYQPHMPGYDQPGRFSGYAARFLPGKLQDAWRRLHPELRYTDAQGEHPAVPLSLDKTVDSGMGARHVGVDRREIEPTATAFQPGDTEGRYPTIDRALTHVPTAARHDAARYLQLTDEGHGVDTIASTMGLRRGDIQKLRTTVRTALSTVLAEAA